MLDFEKMANGGLARIKPYQAGKPIEEVKRELGLDEVIKLASNENPFGMSKKAVEAAKKAIDEGNFYPDSNGFYLKHALHEAHYLRRGLQRTYKPAFRGFCK